MDLSPNKHVTIENLEGDATSIWNRGNQITTLATEMQNSATLLQQISEGATGQKGLAVDKLKGIVGDTYKQLSLAADRYTPSGKALTDYATTLSAVQPKINDAAGDCVTLWNAYETKLGEVVPTSAPSGTEPDSHGAAPADDDGGRAAAKTAYNAWRDRAEDFEGYYETWETAFDDAVNKIHDADGGGIHDTFWDKFDAFVAVALKVLNIVGLVLVIAAIIIGGPILGLLVAIVAVATLALTVYAYCRGNATITDVVFAAIAVVPFGRLGSLFKGGGEGLDFAKGLIGLAEKDAPGVRAQFTALKTAFTEGGGLKTLFDHGGGAWDAITSFYKFDGGAGVNVITRLFTGRTLDGLDDLSKATTDTGKNIANLLSGVWGDGFLKNVFGTADMALGVGGHGHNDAFPSGSLSHPLFGPQSVVG